MRIVDLRVIVHEREARTLFPGDVPTVENAVLTITTDEGIEGHTFISPPQPDVAQQLVGVAKPRLLGRDPLDIGAIWGQLGARRELDPTVQSYVDVALWDIAGKAAGLPLHRLLGTVRTAIPAYASSWVLPAEELYVEEALAYREQGFVGYKVHPPSMFGARAVGGTLAAHVDRDVDVYRRVRSAVGPSYTLFADPFARYSYAQALRVGRELEALDYEWYEDPLAADDIDGYRRLKESLTIPLLATELTVGGLPAHVPWAVRGATDYLRGDVVLKGGVTGLLKLARLAEAFNLNCELHDGYSALNNLAVLHVALAVPNCTWFEVLVPHVPGRYDTEYLNWGLAEPVTIDGEGLVHSPEGPGLGIDVDWDLIRSRTLAELR